MCYLAHGSGLAKLVRIRETNFLGKLDFYGLWPLLASPTLRAGSAWQFIQSLEVQLPSGPGAL